jgi:hypothetical protein
MRRLDFSSPSILDDAWKVIDEGEPLEIVISNWQAKVVAKAFPHYLAHYAADRTPNQRRWSLLKFAPFGFGTPTLWAICARVVVKGGSLHGTENDGTFVVSCRPPAVR